MRKRPLTKDGVHGVRTADGMKIVTYCPECDHPLNDDGTECLNCDWVDGTGLLLVGFFGGIAAIIIALIGVRIFG